MSRVVASVLGGYALAYTATASIAVLLPMARSEAVLTASMVSFPTYTAAILWAFAAVTPTRAWIGLLVPTTGCAAIVYLLHSPH